jgi:copper(I)-binding protein
MKLEEGVMRMRAVPAGLELPAGKTVELKPGGYHLMLLDLKQPLPKESTIPLTLVFQDAKGVQTRTELKVPVGMQPPADAAAPTKP